MRYALFDRQGDFKGKYPNLKEALYFARKLGQYRIWDTIEDRIIISGE